MPFENCENLKYLTDKNAYVQKQKRSAKDRKTEDKKFNLYPLHNVRILTFVICKVVKIRHSNKMIKYGLFHFLSLIAIDKEPSAPDRASSEQIN